jgi:transposase
LCNPQESISPRHSGGSRFASYKYAIIDYILTTLDTGSVLLFLPAYSPDFNPIEESFSAGKPFMSL